MLKAIFFVIWAAIIPIVPLLGAAHYHKKENRNKTICCWVIFGVQLFISTASIFEYLKLSV